MSSLLRLAQLIREADEYADKPGGDALKEKPELRRIVDDAKQKERLRDFEPDGNPS